MHAVVVETMTQYKIIKLPPHYLKDITYSIYGSYFLCTKMKHAVQNMPLVFFVIAVSIIAAA